MKTLVISLLFPLVLSAQGDDLFIKKFRSGVGSSFGIGVWNQDALNRVLNNNNTGDVPTLQFATSFQVMGQWDKLRLGLELGRSKSSADKGGQEISQKFTNVELSGNYAIIKNRSIRLAPKLGGGYMWGNTRVRNELNTSTTFSQLFANRNSVDLFNSQGFADIGLILGFWYSPEMKEHIYEVIAGYRAGFSASAWDKNDARVDANSQLLSEEIRQWYLSLKITLFGGRKLFPSNR